MMSLGGMQERPLLNSILVAAANFDPSRRQAIVVIYDPRDKSIFWPESQLHAVIRDTHMPIYTIAIQSEGEVEPSTFPDILTEATGGRRFVAAASDDIPEIENKIKIELQYQYILTYTPGNATPAGAYHQVEVRMAPPLGLPALQTWLLLT
jgi:Ca-activated chloride channel homolog